MTTLDLSDRPAMRQTLVSRPSSPTARAIDDLAQGLLRWWLWALVAWWDIKQRYRGSVLGPFWLTLSTAVMVGSLGALYSRLFHMDLATYLPYLSLGILTWGLISALLTECCTAFIVAEHLIKQIRMPFAVHLYRVIARNLIVFGHNMVVFVVVAFWFRIPAGWADLMVVPGMVLLVLGMIPIGLMLAATCARFRDIPPVVGSLLQVVFFMTPIMSRPELLGDRQVLALYNPFNCVIDLVRAPLLGEWAPATSWAMALGIALLAWIAAFPFFVRFRARIAYWV